MLQRFPGFCNINLIQNGQAITPCYPKLKISNLPTSNIANISQAIIKVAIDDEALDVPVNVSNITTVIFNSIICPFTVVLNVLVIMAVKRRPGL